MKDDKEIEPTIENNKIRYLLPIGKKNFRRKGIVERSMTYYMICSTDLMLI